MAKNPKKMQLPRRSGTQQWTVRESKGDKGPSMPPQTTRAATPREELEHVLERFYHHEDSSVGPVPDYHSFTKWFLERSAPSGDDGIVFNRVALRGSNKRADYISAFIKLYSEYDSWMQSDPFSNAGEDKFALLKKFHKFKLLFSFLQNSSPRFREVVEATIKERNRTWALDEGLDDCSQAQLRFRLDEALARGMEKIAFKIVGKLKLVSHDNGEVDFLESQAYFRSNDFIEAIRLAEKVPADAIDYPAAQAIILESTAFLGDITRFVARLSEIDPDKISPAFYLYLMLCALSNAQSPMDILKSENKIDDKVRPIVRVMQDDVFYPTLNRYICGLATRYAEHIIQKKLSEDASAQTETGTAKSTNAQLDDRNEIDEDSATALLADMDQTEQRLVLALSFDHKFFTEILNQNSDEYYVPICKRLLNVSYSPSFQDYKEALLTQLRLGGEKVFVDNIVRLIAERKAFPQKGVENPAISELYELAWVAARAINHECIEILDEAIKDLRLPPTKLGSLELDGNSKAITQALSPMGRLAYESAEGMLKAAVSRDNSWQDAGMISLGFIRILELELNQRFLIPLRNEGKGITLIAAMNTAVQDIKATGESKSAAKEYEKTSAYWGSAIKLLKEVLDGSKSGLEMGPLQHLLGKAKGESGIDKEVKRIVFEALSRSLTCAGEKAYRAGEIDQIIGEDVRNRFRNPPAHTRYLSLTTAVESKQYVDQCLTKFKSWFVQEV